MKKWKKVLLWFGWITIGLFIVVLSIIGLTDRYFATKKGAAWLYNDVPAKVKVLKADSDARFIRLGDSSLQPLMLIHGAPGSIYDWKPFASFSEIYKDYCLYIVDRPGYGATRRGDDRLSVIDQAKILIEVLRQIDRPTVIMGHSYGAPVAIVIAALQPDLTKTVVSVAGQFDPENEVFFRINKLINFKVFKYTLPSMIWVSNREKILHPDALVGILPYYSKVTCNVHLLHGDQDSLVPYENSVFALQQLNNYAILHTLPGYDHALQITDPELLVDFVLENEL